MKKLIYQVVGYTSVCTNEETGEIEQRAVLSQVTVENPTEADIAKAAEIAHNGDYIIEDDGEPENPVDGDSVWDELDAAYQEGVDSV